MNYKCNSKNNFMAFDGLWGWGWANGMSGGEVAEKMGITWNTYCDIHEEARQEYGLSYSDSCNSQDYFKEIIKTDEEFQEHWKLIQEGKSDYPFPTREHHKAFIMRKI